MAFLGGCREARGPRGHLTFRDTSHTFRHPRRLAGEVHEASGPSARFRPAKNRPLPGKAGKALREGPSDKAPCHPVQQKKGPTEVDPSSGRSWERVGELLVVRSARRRQSWSTGNHCRSTRPAGRLPSSSGRSTRCRSRRRSPRRCRTGQPCSGWHP